MMTVSQYNDKLAIFVLAILLIVILPIFCYGQVEKEFKQRGSGLEFFENELNKLQNSDKELNTRVSEASEQLRNLESRIDNMRMDMRDLEARIRDLEITIAKGSYIQKNSARSSAFFTILLSIVLVALGISLFITHRSVRKTALLDALVQKMMVSSADRSTGMEQSLKGIDKLKKDIAIMFDFMNLFPRKNPYVVGAPVINGECFVGRSEIISSILNGIHANDYYILGERRSGKTSLLKMVAEKLRNFDSDMYILQPVPVDFQSICEKTLFNSLAKELLNSAFKLAEKHDLHNLSKKLESKFQSWINTAEYDDDVVELVFQLHQIVLSEYELNLIFVLIIDEFDKMNGFEVQVKESFRSIFMRTENHLRLIAAGGKLEKWDRTSPFNFMIEKTLSGLSKQDAVKLIKAPAKGIVVWDDAAVDYILDSSQRKPYEIQKLCADLVDYALENKIFRVDEQVMARFAESKS